MTKPEKIGIIEKRIESNWMERKLLAIMDLDYMEFIPFFFNKCLREQISKINILSKLLLIDEIMSADDMQEIVCPNPECEYYLRVDGKAIIKRGKYKTGHQRYNCKHCCRFFMDTVGTAIYRKHLPKDEIKLIYRLYLEKNGIRSIERITGHHRDTVSNLIRDTVRNDKTEEYLVKQIGLTENECEKLWALLEKKRNNSHKPD